jgi:hypothetical protein
MGITDRLYRLGHAAERLNRGTDELNMLLARIDDALGRLNVGMDYTHARPLHEDTSVGADGKRVISMGYLAFARHKGRFRLLYKNVKILESRRDSASELPGTVLPLLEAPRTIRHRAVDLLPDLVGGLSERVDEYLGQLERRREVASSVLKQLESMLPPTGASEDRPPTPRW